MRTAITLLMMVVGEVRFGELPPSKVTPSKPQPQQKSDLHSHLCSKCNHEWWHDPTKGPVSHNCPRCGRQQFVVNRTAPTGARPTNSTAASPQQVVRAPVTSPKQKIVWVIGSTTCGACIAGRNKHGDGTPELRYIYVYMDKPRPADIEVDVWNKIVGFNNSGRFLWPFFVVKLDDGEFVAVQARVE